MIGNYILEVCANSVQSAIVAEQAGANRLELCENLFVGGTTPSYGCIKLARKFVNIDINVLVRPRYGDFLYSDIEFEQIKEDVLQAKKLGVNGIVCGLLLPSGDIDVKRTYELVQLAKPLTFTFHRAFDFTPNPIKALDDIIKTGATHLLTSGQRNKAIDGVDLISEIVKHAGNKIEIIVGSGVNIQSIKKLMPTGAKQFHMSGSGYVETSMHYRKENLQLNGEIIPEYKIQLSMQKNIEQVVTFLDSKGK